MKKLVIGALALAGIALSVPANAQGVYIGVGGGPSYYGSGGPGYYGSNGYDGGYRSNEYDGGYRTYRPRYSYEDSYAQDYRQCRTVRVRVGHHLRRVRSCS